MTDNSGVNEYTPDLLMQTYHTTFSSYINCRKKKKNEKKETIEMVNHVNETACVHIPVIQMVIHR